ncbi:acyl-CoA dehydrogenase family protein [Streptomyces sp. NPDC048301]|uniref:acyl-CoA dehydrogenase family protein n=1 Tax=Streptomyces sp. NPDC048301 TaxID=3155631 RepID=UPI00342DCA64
MTEQAITPPYTPDPLLTPSAVPGAWLPAPRPEVVRAAAVAGADARRADREGRLSPATVEAVTDAGLPAHFVGRGGEGAGSFSALFADITALAQECPSAAWCGALWAAHGRFASCLPESGRRELWADGPDARIASAVAPPAGSAVVTAEGLRLNGVWECVSGARYSDWILLATPVTRAHPEHGRPEPWVLAVPTDELTVHDTWDATGLRGTASDAVEVCDLLVPAHRSFPLAGMLDGTGNHGAGRQHRAPAQLAGGLIFCATALGAAHALRRAWSAWTTEGVAGTGGRGLCDSPAARDALAVSSARIDAAHLLLARAAFRADTEPATETLTAVNQRDAAFAAGLLLEAANHLFGAGGVHVRDAGGDVQRLWRDVQTAARHGVLRMEPAAASYARAEQSWPHLA